jgi:LuxR family transcriptional regulator, quorum-sensing system regulator CviR
MHTLLTKLGQSDLILLLELIDQSRFVKDKQEMGALLRDLSINLPTQGVIAGLMLEPTASIRSEEVPFINLGYSDEWLKEYLRNDYFSCDPIKRARVSGIDFMRWSETFVKAEKPSERQYIRQAREYDIYEGVTIGAHGASGRPISFFSFIGAGVANNEHDQILLRHLSPFLHEAMCRATPTSKAAGRAPLSERETEVLSWAMAGKTNWEISIILNISERTVKFHIQNVMGKLQASSRAHAVAIALGEGLIGR